VARRIGEDGGNRVGGAVTAPRGGPAAAEP